MAALVVDGGGVQNKSLAIVTLTLLLLLSHFGGMRFVVLDRILTMLVNLLCRSTDCQSFGWWVWTVGWWWRWRSFNGNQSAVKSALGHGEKSFLPWSWW